LPEADQFPKELPPSGYPACSDADNLLALPVPVCTEWHKEQEK
jgi:hypothetical protein